MFFKCSPHAPIDDQPSGRAVSNGSSSQVVDIHCHRECAPAAEMMKAEAERAGFGALAFGSDLTKEVNQQRKSILDRFGEKLKEFLDNA